MFGSTLSSMSRIATKIGCSLISRDVDCHAAGRATKGHKILASAFARRYGAVVQMRPLPTSYWNFRYGLPVLGVL